MFNTLKINHLILNKKLLKKKMIKTRAELTEQLKDITISVVDFLGSDCANKALDEIRDKIVSKYINKLFII